ncbi:MAG: hypothetical protein DRJ03_29745, partial [Chloroflexi bacterium]
MLKDNLCVSVGSSTVDIVPEHIVYVSGSFTDSTSACEFNTIKAAVSFVENQSPDSTSPWAVYIYPGYYQEERGTWVEDTTESSIIMPDYTFIVGVDRDAVIIEPDGNVVGESMNFFAGVQEGDQDPLLNKHFGFSNVTIQNVLYGDAVQLDSFIKKKDGYPEFRCYLDNVKFVNCNVGIKTEERNSWTYGNNLLFVDCNRSIDVDDGKFFGGNIFIRQKSSATLLEYGINCEDKKGKVQIAGLDIGIDFDGLDVAYGVGLNVKDKAEIHVYSGRVDNAQTALKTDDHGEFKGWSVKFHDSSLYDIDVAGEDDSVEIFAGEFDSPIRVQDAAHVKFRNTDINTDDKEAHTIEWQGLGGKLELLNCGIKSAGEISTVEYYCVKFVSSPDHVHIINNKFMFEEDNDTPDYLIYANNNVDATIDGNYMEVGMNGKIIRNSSLKLVGGNFDKYSTIQDAITSASSGDLVFIEPGTYEEQITIRNGVSLQGRDKASCVVQYLSDVIQWDPSFSSATISGLEFRVTSAGNRIMDVKRRYPIFKDCDFREGYISANGQTDHIEIRFNDCFFRWYENDIIDVVDTDTGRNCIFKLTDCGLEGDISFHTARGQLRISRGDFSWARIVYRATGNLATNFWFVDSNITREGSDLVTVESSGGGILKDLKIVNNEVFDESGHDGLVLKTAPSSVTIGKNKFSALTGLDINVYSGVSISGAIFSGNTMVTGIGGSGVFGHINAIKNVGGATDFYSTIQHAINGASSGDLIQVNPGTYSEQITMKAGITIQGVNKDACILQYSDQPIQPWAVGGGATKIKSMTLKVTTANNTIVELRNGYYDFFEDCAFLAGRSRLIGANLRGFPQFEFQSCYFLSDGHYVIEASGSTSRNVMVKLKDCEIKAESSGIS